MSIKMILFSVLKRMGRCILDCKTTEMKMPSNLFGIGTKFFCDYIIYTSFNTLKDAEELKLTKN